MEMRLEMNIAVFSSEVLGRPDYETYARVYRTRRDLIGS
jgi:hypothetical protein